MDIAGDEELHWYMVVLPVAQIVNAEERHLGIDKAGMVDLVVVAAVLE